ncbi:MAG: single-stranded-DNA-specific exonuclease RecJ [Bacteroidaceae bacterium]|nr:single-stranded-DNA-specific exonuclease RecJ [Bacteroidaceae bacterium]MBO7346840.1 single-stranded-DNA-specific exonuclease RecJ [Bacteroidaceae bacterium]
MNYRWQFKEPTRNQQEQAKTLSRELGISPILGQLLVDRGITGTQQAGKFFRPQLSDLLDPFLFRDMEVAVKRINEALGRKEKIMVYGDYDVDGVTAVALVYKFLQKYSNSIEYYIPDRYEEGYGVSKQGIDYASESGVKLIIVLDCGIKAVQEISYAREKGIDFIICDHHVPDAVLPPAVAILNAKRTDGTYPYGDLCGCGVGFKLIQGFAKSNGIPFSDLVPLLDLCAVSIAADIVPIMGENRILAFHGLRQLNQSPCVGLRAIMNIAGMEGKEVHLPDIIYKIGPRLNASGRIENGRESVALLVETDMDAAERKAAQIDHYNEQRKDLDKVMTEQANQIVETLVHRNEHKGIVVYNEEWHKGVIGIVASRLTEIFFRPAVVLTRDGDFATGSARSVAGFDIYAAIESCRDILENFGGHTYAAGLTIKADRVEEFKHRFEEYVDTHILPGQTDALLNVDSTLSFREIDRKFFSDLKRFQPFGPENTKPLFCTRQVYDYGTSKVVGREQEHIRLELVDNRCSKVMNGIAFGQSSQARYIKTKRSFNIVYSIEENAYKRGEIQLQIEDIEATELD